MAGRVSSAVRGVVRVAACAVACLALAHCSNNRGVDARYGVSASERLVPPGEPVPKGGGVYRVGNPYVVAGRVYVPEDNPRYRAEGVASWYGSDFHGRQTANGEIFDAESISAAHPTLPLPSYVRVTNLGNGHSLIVRVNDRGPYAGNRLIDVSKRAAHLLGFTVRGTAFVRVEYVGRAPIEGSDDRLLEATLRENGPAPAPWDTRLAATSLIPSFPPQPPPVRNQRFASASPTATATDDMPVSSPGRASLSSAVSSQAMSYADAPDGASGTAQFLNGRGLY
ncbi:MAG: septal ring lytic transglycosylase RlpA family protein [Xanthobacteraceae bacterium]|jgi:rare lipoprotein A